MNTVRLLQPLLLLTSVLMASNQAHAQLVSYQFSGTKIEGSPGVGETITGTITLNVDAVPYSWMDLTPYVGCGEEAHWVNDGFAIEASTDTGIQAGSSFGADTYFGEIDIPCSPHHTTFIASWYFGETSSAVIDFYAQGNAPTGDGVAEVPNPWDPLATPDPWITIYAFDSLEGIEEYGLFSLDTFGPLPTTIIIDGVDTGIDDFEYEGRLVSEYLDEFAADARNHGDFVSSVARLTNDLKKAGLLTNKQKALLMRIAAGLSIGQ